LPLWTAVIGGLWVVWTYIDNEHQAREAATQLAKRESRTRLLEAQKPFLDRQLALYFETAQVAGRLVTLPRNDPIWQQDDKRLEELYWSELTMVEQPVVAEAMKNFRNALAAFEREPTPAAPQTSDALHREALGLANALRAGIKQSWEDPNSGAIVAP